ncbi:MAG TPA: hypothetical protein VMB74_08850 [Streptosporangiaceae bacterium]|nr:hypothetical protein [Streptosporangiaceae bacterium]
MTIDGVNTGAAVVSIAVAVETIQRVARGILRRRHPLDPDLFTVDVSIAGEHHSLTVNRKAPTAENEILDFLITALDHD